MQSISIHLSLIKTWITMTLSEQSHKYQEWTTISIISLMIFNCSGRTSPFPRRHLTCSQAWSAPFASLPIFSGEKRCHQAERTEGAEGRTDPHTLQKEHPCPFEWLLMKKVYIAAKLIKIPRLGCLPFLLVEEKPRALLPHLAVCWHRYQLSGLFLHKDKTQEWLHYIRLRSV